MDVIRSAVLSAMLFLLAVSVQAEPYREPLTPTERIQLQSAMDRRQIGDTIGAIKILRQFLKSNPHHPRATRQFYRWVEPEISDTQYIQSLKHYFRSSGEEELFLAILSRSSLEEPDRFQLLRWAVERFPSSATLHTRWIKTADRLNHDTVVESNRRPLLEQFPGEADLVEFYASWLRERGQWERASEFYRRLMKLRPGYNVGYQGLSDYYRRTGKRKKARELEERAGALKTRH